MWPFSGVFVLLGSFLLATNAAAGFYCYQIGLSKGLDSGVLDNAPNLMFDCVNLSFSFLPLSPSLFLRT